MDTKQAIQQFEKSAIIHGRTQENGDYKTGNKHHNIIQRIILYLHDNNQMMLLDPFLTHPDNAVRLWAAFALLPYKTSVSEQVMSEIARGKGMVSFNAEMTLSEWKKGTLIFPY